MLAKLRAFADIGRTQGITTTGSIAIVGALTSTAPVAWYHIVFFTLVAIVAHMALNTYIAMGDRELDGQTYVPSRNPITAGTLTRRDALLFVYGGTSASMVLCLVPITIGWQTLVLSVLAFIPAYWSLVWYGWKGKRYLVSYDFTFSISYAFFVLFGVFAVGGMPTAYTWIFVGVVIFAATAFAQWENGLKDVDADRFAKVRSLAVHWNVRNGVRLTAAHPYFLYGCVLKAGFLACCAAAFFLSSNYYFLVFVLLFGVPSQVFIMYRFLTKERAIDHRKTILLDVTFAAIIGYSVIVDKTGVVPILLLVVYLIGGYLIGSLLQSNCEFKFGRFLARPSP